MKTRLVIIECAGYILWQLFLRQLYYEGNTDADPAEPKYLENFAANLMHAVELLPWIRFGVNTLNTPCRSF